MFFIGHILWIYMRIQLEHWWNTLSNTTMVEPYESYAIFEGDSSSIAGAVANLFCMFIIDIQISVSIVISLPQVSPTQDWRKPGIVGKCRKAWTERTSFQVLTTLPATCFIGDAFPIKSDDVMNPSVFIHSTEVPYYSVRPMSLEYRST